MSQSQSQSQSQGQSQYPQHIQGQSRHLEQGQEQNQTTAADIGTIVRNSREITEFQRKVYLELLKVPAGETISYGELARRSGCRSAQAIGQAMRRNPFAPAVPCHRVIRADGTPGGYGGSTAPAAITRKLALLTSEKH